MENLIGKFEENHDSSHPLNVIVEYARPVKYASPEEKKEARAENSRRFKEKNKKSAEKPDNENNDSEDDEVGHHEPGRPEANNGEMEGDSKHHCTEKGCTPCIEHGKSIKEIQSLIGNQEKK